MVLSMSRPRNRWKMGKGLQKKREREPPPGGVSKALQRYQRDDSSPKKRSCLDWFDKRGGRVAGRRELRESRQGGRSTNAKKKSNIFHGGLGGGCFVTEPRS